MLPVTFLAAIKNVKNNVSMIDYLFFTYIVIAITYNVISIGCNDLTSKQLSPSEPVPSITMLVALYLVYSAPELSDAHNFVRSFLLFVFLIIILRFGIVRHLINYKLEQYFSHTSRISAAVINIFGVLLLLHNLIFMHLVKSL